MANQGQQERKHLAMIGTTGVGKSSLANVLMGIDPWEENNTNGFVVGSDAESVTLNVGAKNGNWLGDASKLIRLIDTPGHGDGQGQDEQLREGLVAGMKREKLVHVFVWVKNSQSPRFDDLDRQFYDIFGQMFGRGFVSNMIVVFTRYKYSAEAERMRQRNKSSSLDKTIEGFRKSIGDVRGIVPMFALDAYYDKENPQEAEMFQKTACEMWAVIQKFSKLPVEHVEAVKDRIAVLTAQIGLLNQQLASMREEHREESQRLREQLQNAEAGQRDLEEQLRRQRDSSGGGCVLM